MKNAPIVAIAISLLTVGAFGCAGEVDDPDTRPADEVVDVSQSTGNVSARAISCTESIWRNGTRAFATAGGCERAAERIGGSCVEETRTLYGETCQHIQ